jgi:hypothetical protein
MIAPYHGSFVVDVEVATQERRQFHTDNKRLGSAAPVSAWLRRTNLAIRAKRQRSLGGAVALVMLDDVQGSAG